MDRGLSVCNVKYRDASVAENAVQCRTVSHKPIITIGRHSTDPTSSCLCPALQHCVCQSHPTYHRTWSSGDHRGHQGSSPPCLSHVWCRPTIVVAAAAPARCKGKLGRLGRGAAQCFHALQDIEVHLGIAVHINIDIYIHFFQFNAIISQRKRYEYINDTF